MQRRFDFGATDITRWRGRLKSVLEGVEMPPPRPPTGQLIKSIISGRTRDEVSGAAYERLRAEYRNASHLATASPAAVEQLIADVTFAEKKAAQLIEALHLIRQRRGDLSLSFLGGIPLDAALLWLEDLPGVGRKVAASVLNASTLDQPVFIVDSHVMRVLGRLGFVDPASEPRIASEAVTATMPGWSPRHFLQFHVELKRLGQLYCHPAAADCHLCPLANDCLEHRRAGRPARASRKRDRSEAPDSQMPLRL